MSIRIDGNFSTFKNVTKQDANAKKSESLRDGKAKTDTIDFDRAHAPAEDREIAALKAKVMRDVVENTDEAKLASLKNAIDGGAYNVSTDEIVGAMLKFMR